MKIVAWAVLAMVGTTVGAVALVFTALQTDPAKDWLVTAINHRLAGTAQIDRLTGTIPWRMSIAEIRLEDRHGTWAQVDDAVCRLKPADLLHGRLTIAELGAARITIVRRPVPAARRTAPMKPTRPPISVNLQRLAVPIVKLDKAVLGTPLTAALTGDATLNRGSGSAALTVERTDGRPGRIDAAFTLSGRPARLSLAADAEDWSGQLLNLLLSRSDNLPLVMQLHGNGPLVDWHGDLAVQAGTLGGLSAAITFSDRNGYRAGIDGRLAASGLLPAKIAPLVGPEARFRLVAGKDPDGAIRFDPIALRLAAADLSGTAMLGAGATGPIAGKLHLALPDLGKLAALAGGSLAGSGIIELTAAGTRSAPWVTATVDGVGLRLAGRSIEHLNAKADAQAQGPLDAPRTPVRFSAEGRLDGLAANGLPTAYRDLLWRVAGSSTTDGRDLHIADLAVHGPGLALTATGRADRQERTLSATIRLAAADLSPLSAAIGRPVSGRADLQGTVGGSIPHPQIDAVLSAEDLRAGAIRLDRIDARIKATGAPTLSAAAHAEFRSGRLSGTLVADGALSPDKKMLDLSRFHFAAGGTSVDAVLRTALHTRLTSGEISARSTDLSPLFGILGVPLAGRLDLRARLAADHGQRVALRLTGQQLSLPSGGGAAATVQDLTATGRFSDLFGKVVGQGSLAIIEAKTAAATLQRLDASAKSRRRGDFTFTAGLDGLLKAKMPVTLAVTGETALGAGALSGRITTLSGHLGDHRLRLERPLRITRSRNSTSFADLRLDLGSGRVSGMASLTPRAVTARLAARNVPLALAEAFAHRDAIGGTLDASAELHGPLDRPVGQLMVTTHGLRLSHARTALPPTDIAAQIRLQPGRMNLTGRIIGPRGEAATLSGAAPVRFTGHPFAASVPRQGQLSLRLRGDGHLQDWTDVLPIGQDRLSGHYHLDLAIAGTVAAPVASGHLTLDHGHFESLAYGTVLNAITVDLEGNRDRIVLRRFTANDGHGGILGIEGSFLPAAPAGPSMDATVTLHHFRFVHTDDAVGHGSGELRVAGSMLEPDVTAHLKIDDAQVYLAERLPPSVRTLKVTVIDSKTGQVLSKPPPPSAKPPIVAALDVRVDIPGPFFVRGRGLDSQWQGRITVGGTSKAPDIKGSLHVTHGTMNFLGKTLNLTRGTITLVGGSKIEPLVDFVAQSSSAKIAAQVEVTGPAEHPKIKLSSQPPLPQDEILSQLLFGSDVTQLSPLEGLQIAQAAADLASGGPGVIDRIRMKFGLDRLNIGSSQQGLPEMPSSPQTTAATTGSGVAGALGNTMISAGKYVAPGVFVGVGQGISGDSQIDVEVELTRHLTIDGTESTQEGTGIGLGWRLDY